MNPIDKLNSLSRYGRTARISVHTWFNSNRKIIRRFLLQAGGPVVLALAYAIWHVHSQPHGQSLLDVWGVSIIFIGSVSGQWLRAMKQVQDSEGFSSLHDRLGNLERMLGSVPEAEINAPTQADVMSFVAQHGASSSVGDQVSSIIDELKRSSRGALLIAGAELERALRNLLWSSGWWQGVGKTLSVRTSMDHLVKLGVLPSTLADSVREFLSIRNPLIHGKKVAEDDIIRAVDIGIRILKSVLAVPYSIHTILYPKISLYSDPAGTMPIAQAEGVVIESINSNGTTHRHVCPIRDREYRTGQRVSWEFNMSFAVGPAWYRDPETNEVLSAFQEAAEFVGRDLDSLP